MRISRATDFSDFELDELYTFIKRKSSTDEGENTYICTMVSRNPRQIVSFAVDKSVNKKALQRVVDGVLIAENYLTDGCQVYCDVIFGGRHRGNVRDKKDTHNVESVNADLRHYLSGLSRHSRCFYRSEETLIAVSSVFVNAYNKYGDCKTKNRVPVKHRSATSGKHRHKYRELPKSLIDFVE